MPKQWNFLTNHALVLLKVYEHPDSTLREIAEAVGITERAALSILSQLQEDSCISKTKHGRRNRYRVNLKAVLARDTRSPYSIEQIVRGFGNLLRQLREEEQNPDPPDGDAGQGTNGQSEEDEDGTDVDTAR